MRSHSSFYAAAEFGLFSFNVIPFHLFCFAVFIFKQKKKQLCYHSKAQTIHLQDPRQDLLYLIISFLLTFLLL